ncbi:MAG: hypothetical protein H6551_00650 [Chitinophagales bacterium]|nr:hypothetical protein [Chitinophagaceae bacterium]MCB9063631.1 hypothetical protein [Chitinophagales bacterium]
MRYKVLLILIPIVLSVFGCKIIDPQEQVPTYVKIDSFDFQTIDPIKEGSGAQGITSVWIYYNNNPVGIFDLPCTVPVITEGDKGVLSVTPGITLNGLQDLQPQYPFFRFDTTAFFTNPGMIREYTPTTSYISSAKFPFKEDFEVGNTFQEFTSGVIGDTSVIRTIAPGNVFEGGASGVIYLDANNPQCENISKAEFQIAKGESYLEVNYKCTAPFQVGLYNTLNSNVDAYDYIFGIKPSDTWKKIYIELGSYTSQNPGKNYRVMIKSELTDGMTSGYVLLDNVKVVSY